VAAGLVQATSGLEATQLALDVWANNLANANTTAFAPSEPIQVSLPETPIPVGNWPGLSRPTPAELAVGTGTALAGARPVFGQGGLVATGIATDVALQGPGFFVVRTPAGVAYTRAGNFSVDGAGNLVTPGGAFVLSTSLSPINVGTGPVSIGPDGTVSSAGKTVANLAVANFPNPGGLVPTQDNLFVAPATGVSNAGAPSVGAPPKGTTILAGTLEGSGTDVSSGLVQVLDLSRNFSLDAKAMSITDQMLSWAAQLT